MRKDCASLFPPPPGSHFHLTHKLASVQVAAQPTESQVYGWNVLDALQPSFIYHNLDELWLIKSGPS